MKDFLLFLPEITLALTLMGIVASEVAYHGERVRLTSAISTVGLVTALINTFASYQFESRPLFSGMISFDGLSLFFKLFFILLAILAIQLASYSKHIETNRRTEYLGFIVASALSMCLVASSTDLLLIFLTLQLMCVLAFFMSGYAKQDLRSTEAAVKFLVFSVLASAFLIYSAAILFSFTKTLKIGMLSGAGAVQPLPEAVGLIVFVLLFLAICFYIGVFPMHLWFADVIDGAPIPTSLMLALGVPAAGFAVGVRLFAVMFSASGVVVTPQTLSSSDWLNIVGLASGVTMLIGALLAFRQIRAKRMLGYLVISQAGFLLLGLMVLDRVGIAALLYNLLVDLFAMAGAFGAFSFLYDRLGTDHLSRFRGALAHYIPESVCFLLFLACFIGMPPFPGFIGKLVLVGVVFERGWYELVAVAIVSKVLATAAFARLSFQLTGDFLEFGRIKPEPVSSERIFLFAIFIPIAFLSFSADSVLGWIQRSLHAILP